MVLWFLFLQRKVYNTVVEDVIANVREAFLDEGVDESVLQELKHVSLCITHGALNLPYLDQKFENMRF